ncbi:MAG: DUF1499 domain-containing protein [Burkholderiales bacterium]|nr:DUF1499 domain-containing protein [Burkholderiales bacterium]
MSGTGLLLMLVLMFPVPGIAAGGGIHDRKDNKASMDVAPYFRTLRRPDSPNHWLAAPAGFPGNPDAAAPVFEVPAAALREALRVVVTQTPGAAVESESAAGMHIVVTTRIFRFRDDVHVQFLQPGPQQSTLAVYSASRVGYWDLGTNRRRVEDWLARIAAVLEAGR